MASNEFVSSRQSRKFRGFTTFLKYPRFGWHSHNCTSRVGSGKGSGRKSMASTTLNMAVFAPIPSASVTTAMAAKPGDLPSTRKP
jgi:hypothetical protein